MTEYKTEYKKKIITAEILDIEPKDTMTGKFLVKFRARTDDGKLYLCTVWEKDAKRFESEVKEGEKIYLEGTEKTENELTIKYFKANLAKAKEESKLPSADEVAKYRAHRVSKGYEFVKVTIGDEKKTISVLRPYCVKVNGAWESKTEYLLRTLGGKYVADAMKQFGSPDGLSASALISKTNPVSYKELINELLAYAAGISGDVLEMEDETKSSLPEVDLPPERSEDELPISLEEV